MNIEDLINLLQDFAAEDPDAQVLVDCEITSSVKHPIAGLRPYTRKDSNHPEVEYLVIESKSNDDRWVE